MIPCQMIADRALKRDDLDEAAGATMAVAEAQGAITQVI